MKSKFILPAALIALTLAGLLFLGFWQLERAEQKRIIERAIAMAESTAPERITQPQVLVEKAYHQVLLEGYYDSDKQFIYDNQIVNSNAGYYVLTPFVLSQNAAILVNRGFVPWHGNRQKLADISVDANKITIQVQLIKPKERIQFKQQHDTDTFPMLIQSLNMEKMSQLSGYQLVPMLARLDKRADNGLYRQWQPFYGSVDKHLGYAFQWFSMALVLLIIAIRLAIKYRK